MTRFPFFEEVLAIFATVGKTCRVESSSRDEVVRDIWGMDNVLQSDFDVLSVDMEDDRDGPPPQGVTGTDP